VDPRKRSVEDSEMPQVASPLSSIGIADPRSDVVTNDIDRTFCRDPQYLAELVDLGNHGSHIVVSVRPVRVAHATLIEGNDASSRGSKQRHHIAPRIPEVPPFANKYGVEGAMRAGGMPYTILRPAYFVQNERRFKSELTGPGVYPLPVGTRV